MNKVFFRKVMSVLAVILAISLVLPLCQCRKKATVEELIAAAESGNAAAQNKLGSMYCYGEGVPTDYREAVKWYRKSADQGNEYAKNALEPKPRDTLKIRR
ncbi:hypothetical protein FACS189416_3840 [Bacteroidia bacterium]|nr:hypothetical protein FACS189416_3840 [Bacteroidia bacterium]